MEQAKFQWSVFSADRVQQWVVRAETFEEFLESVKMMQMLLPVGERLVNGTSAVPTEGAHSQTEDAQVNDDNDQQICPTHQQPMTLRTAKDGKHWYDHRWQQGTVWYQCNGKTVRTNEIRR